MKNNVVSVFLWGKEVCKIMWLGGYNQGFGKVGAQVSFNPEYHKYGFDIDPVGPYRVSTYLVQKGMSDICRNTKESLGLPRFLHTSLPDDWGNKVFSLWIENNGLRNHDVTPVDKLAFIGKRGMGGFEFIPQLYDTYASESIILEDLYGLAKEIQEAREDLVITLNNRTELNDLMAVGMSAGGKHPKAIIAINWKTNEVRSGQILLPEDFSQYILKFRDSKIWPTAEIEYAYYKMALASGINMEKSFLLPVGGDNHFLTERFDRKEGKKLHSATLFSLYGEVTSYDEIFRICRRMRLPYQDIEELYRRAVFNYLAGVSDDHDKNFSFIMSECGAWRLSPAYDITYTIDYSNPFIGDKHAMSIEESNRLITRSQLLRLANENDVRNAEKIISEIVEVILSFESIASELGIDKYFRDLIRDFIKEQVNNL